MFSPKEWFTARRYSQRWSFSGTVSSVSTLLLSVVTLSGVVLSIFVSLTLGAIGFVLAFGFLGFVEWCFVRRGSGRRRAAAAAGVPLTWRMTWAVTASEIVMWRTSSWCRTAHVLG